MVLVEIGAAGGWARTAEGWRVTFTGFSGRFPQEGRGKGGILRSEADLDGRKRGEMAFCETNPK